MSNDTVRARVLPKKSAILVGGLLGAALALLPRVALAGGPFDAEVAARRAEVVRRAGTPGAIVPLLGLLDLWNQVEDRAAIAGLLDAVVSDGKQRADVRGRAIFLRSLVEDRLGRAESARAMRAGLGLVGEWMVLGPFDDEGRAGDRMAPPPEKELVEAAGPRDAAKTWAGKERPVSWRAFPSGSVTQGLVSLEAALRPEQNVLGYAETFVHVDADTAAAVRVGSTGAIKVWVNGALVVENDAYRPVRLDQDVGPARLKKGWNRVAVKLGAADAGWSFFLRLTAPDGAPIAFQAATRPGEATAATGATTKELSKSAINASTQKRPAASRDGKLADLRLELRRAAEKGDALASRDYGLYLHYVAPEDPSLGNAERVLQFAAETLGSTEAYRQLAMAAESPDKRRKWLEEAAAPERLKKGSPFERARALWELGEAYAKLHRERRAEELWRAALVEDAEFFPASVKLADLLSDRGLPGRAQGLLDELEKKHPTLAVLRAAANLADRRGRKQDAARRYQAILDATRDDLSSLRELYTYARERGDTEGALRLGDRMMEVRPDLLSLRFDRAELLDGLGQTAAAHEALEAARALCPDDPRLVERDAKLLHRLGRDREALAAFHRALDLRPQNPDLRAYLRELEAPPSAATATATTNAGPDATGRASSGGGDDLARTWQRPVEELIASARARSGGDPAKPGAATKGAGSARVLLDLTATRVHPNGLSESFNQRVVEILDERGAREQGSVDIHYTPDSQSVEVKSAKVYKRSGEVEEAVSQTDHDGSEPWYGLYYDIRVQEIEFPRLEPGDVVAVEYVISDVGKKNLFADYFGELHILQEDLPRLESAYVLVTPKARAFYFNQPRLPGTTHLTIDDKVVGDERVYSFRAVDVPKVEAEPGMPGYTSVAAYVHVSTYKTWEEVATWYQGLLRGQLEPDDAIRHAVADATQGLTDERLKIRAIYDLVVTQTRYVGLEFGIHGFKPYTASQIFQRKFGDCKDKASLLTVMLKEIGVEATLVLARTRHGGDLDAFPASLAPFDHAIVYVPKYDLYLDGTAEFSGSGELPAQDQDIPVLLVSDPKLGGKGHLTRTPVLEPEKNKVTRNVDVDLSSTGSATVALTMTVSGEAAHEWRSHYQSPGERRERFEKAENATHPGAKVTRVEFPGLDDLERPVEVRSALEVPSWARPTGPAGKAGHEGRDLAMPALGREGELLRSYARLSERTHELVLGYPWQQEEQVHLMLPKGYAPKRLPEARRIETPFGTFTVSVERKGQEVRMATSLRVRKHRITPSEYPAFRRFCLDVDAAVGQELVISHE